MQFSLSVKNTFISLNERKPTLRRAITAACISNTDLMTEVLSQSSTSSLSIDSQLSEPKRMRQINVKAAECTMKESEFTTVMIRNIPNRYTPEWLLEEISSAECNFLHLPKARRTSANLGYAFVNFVSADAARKFVAEFEGHQFIKQPNSAKRALTSFADLQGFDSNVEFYSRPKIAAKLERAPWVKY